MFSDMSFGQVLKLGLIWLGVFAMIGGIIAQMTSGVSGRGFVEGMWKGIEWFFIAVLALGVIFAIIWGMGQMSSAINSH